MKGNHTINPYSPLFLTLTSGSIKTQLRKKNLKTTRSVVVERDTATESSVLMTNLAAIEKVTVVMSCDSSKYTNWEEYYTWFQVEDDDTRYIQLKEFPSTDNPALISLMIKQLWWKLTAVQGQKDNGNEMNNTQNKYQLVSPCNNKVSFSCKSKYCYGYSISNICLFSHFNWCGTFYWCLSSD